MTGTSTLGRLFFATILFAFLCLHLPQAAADPLVGFRWTNPCKALAMLGGETSGVFEALAVSGAAFILADRGRLRRRSCSWPDDKI